MKTVFSYIVQKRLSQENENVATDALAYVVNSCDGAHTGLMNVLKSFQPLLPSLSIRTQLSTTDMRPDMWGYDGTSARAFIENKFWAGLTPNQPVNYLRHLAEQGDGTILLMVVPKARQDTIWRELLARLEAAGISTDNPVAGDCGRSVRCSIGPLMAITSWELILDSIQDQIGDDSDAESDLLQLRALCCAADEEAFIPFSPEESTDQRTPALVMQATSIFESVTEWGVTESILSIDGLTAVNSAKKFGRYVKFTGEETFGAWFGVHYAHWKRYGASPLWLVFSFTGWSNGHRAQQLLDSWKRHDKGFFLADANEILVPLPIPAGEGKDEVLRHVQAHLRKISDIFREAQQYDE